MKKKRSKRKKNKQKRRKKAKPALEKLPVVELTFFDHTFHEHHDGLDSMHLMPCHLYGLLVKEDATTYYVATWVCDGQSNHLENDVYTIARSCVINLRVLK